MAKALTQSAPLTRWSPRTPKPRMERYPHHGGQGEGREPPPLSQETRCQGGDQITQEIAPGGAQEMGEPSSAAGQDRKTQGSDREEEEDGQAAVQGAEEEACENDEEILDHDGHWASRHGEADEGSRRTEGGEKTDEGETGAVPAGSCAGHCPVYPRPGPVVKDGPRRLQAPGLSFTMAFQGV